MNEGPVFELEIERVRTRYRARVRRSTISPGGKRPFSLPSEHTISLALTNIHPRHLKVNPLLQQEVSPEEFGRQLFGAIFVGPLLTAWRVATAQPGVLLRLRLDSDPQLLRVPWELLFDPEQGEFIATERRIVRSLDLPESRLLKVTLPLRILVVLSNPTVDLLDIEREWAALDEVLGERVELRVVPPRLDEIDRALKTGEWHILHFVGHGGMDGEGGFLILEDRRGEALRVDHLRLGKFLRHPSLRLVVLNACEGGIPAVEDAFSGVAQSLLKRGASAVLAMQQVISDGVAISFAKHFYEALGQSLSIGSSVLEARQALYRDNEPEWAVPVLYLSTPDGSLIGPREEQPNRWERWKKPIIGITMGVVLASIITWSFLKPPPPTTTTDPEICASVKGAEKNPPECPSPEGLNMAFIRIDQGAFIMGRSGGSKDDEPEHLVTIPENFCIGAYEVTQEQWNLVAGDPPPESQDRCLPKNRVKYEEAQSFVDHLNERDSARPYRLVTEAEWEYVARGKSQAMLLNDPSAPIRGANCGENGDGLDGLAHVGRFSPNSWGVYDMQGNVFEWVAGWHATYPIESLLGPRAGEKRVRRGGSWKSGSEACSATARSIIKDGRRDKENGFRIVREIR